MPTTLVFQSYRQLYEGIIAGSPWTGYFISNVTEEEKPKMVAIVDDDESVRAALLGLMKQAGYPAFAFETAEAFLSSSETERTGCLIADIRMPGMSGLELQSRLNKDHKRIPIIFITAQGDEDDRMQALRGGAVDFLTKPFDDELLLESIQAAMGN